MLPQSKRLNLKESFTWVAAGQKAGNNLMRIFFRFGDNEQPLVGISAPKSAFLKAVERNKARRKVSTAFESLYKQIVPKANIIALPKKEILQASSSEVQSSVEGLLRKEGLFVIGN